jgi:hypothetical protein
VKPYAVNLQKEVNLVKATVTRKVNLVTVSQAGKVSLLSLTMLEEKYKIPRARIRSVTVATKNLTKEKCTIASKPGVYAKKSTSL